jgi:hypothetical protein
MRKLALATLGLTLLACGPDSEATGEPTTTPATLRAAGPELAATAVATAAPVEPRSPARLLALLAEHDRLMQSGADGTEIARVREQIDHAAAQRDALTSRLYWYTDLEEAKAEAKRSSRPILSLRLLGQLDRELSCANSRLFRIVLYANPRVAAFLRDTYVLHWQSERPVPEISIDFGDGRKITRTITGNSIHYVLDSEGRVVDALPGLYGPAAFEKGLMESLQLAKKSATLTDAESQKAIAKYHEEMVWKLTARWRKLLFKAYGDGYGDMLGNATLPRSVGYTKWPDAMWSSMPAAMVNQLTVSKADTEAPPLALMQPEIYVGSPWEGWDKIATVLPADRLDPASRAFAKTKHPRNFDKPDAEPLDDAAVEKRVTRFELRLAEESARNEYAFHGAIHNHLSVQKNGNLVALNEWVYTKVFMTPQKDAWLGLMPTEAITGIAEDGVTKP